MIGALYLVAWVTAMVALAWSLSRPKVKPEPEVTPSPVVPSYRLVWCEALGDVIPVRDDQEV